MKKGIDISEWNSNIDYEALKNDGIEFVIIRCGYGKNRSQKDKLFEVHYEGCKRAGLKIGAYLYSYCNDVDNAIKEAENCLSFIEGKQFDLPIFYDLEDKTTMPLGKKAITEIALRFCRKIEEAGFKAGVYANLNWFKNYIDPYSLVDEHFKIWLAEWGVSKPSATFPYQYWQFTDELEVAEITADGNYAEEKEFTENVENVEKNVEKSYYQNGSTPEPVYADYYLTKKIGELNPYEKCTLIDVYEGRPIVRYVVDGTMEANGDCNEKIGFVEWLGGVKEK